MLSWKRFIPEVVFIIRAVAQHAWTQRQNFCQVCLTLYGNSLPCSVHLSWISFTTLSMYCPFFLFFTFANNNFCLYFLFSTIISTRSSTKLSFHWHFYFSSFTLSILLCVSFLKQFGEPLFVIFITIMVNFLITLIKIYNGNT